MLGTAVGNYRIVDKISEGGMGAVYRAEHALIGKGAAVKVLLPELSMNRDVVHRFFNEARATTQIRHPGIVEIYDFGFLPSARRIHDTTPPSPDYAGRAAPPGRRPCHGG